MRRTIVLLFALTFVVASPVYAQDQQEEEEANSAAAEQYGVNEPSEVNAFECQANEEQVDVLEGTTDDAIEGIEITGPEWRFITEARPKGVTTGTLNVDALDKDGFFVAFTSQLIFPDEERDLQSSGYADGPGTFDFDIESNGATWKITVCQEESGGGGNPEPEPPNPEPPVDPTPDPPKDIIMPPGLEGKKLADTGGPSFLILAGALLVGAGLLSTRILRK